MRKTLIAAALVLSSCGGGGGGSEDSGVDKCFNYCNFTCHKIATCAGMDISGANVCANECYVVTQQNGRSEDSCEATQMDVQSMSCHQLLQTVGMARVKSIADSDLGMNVGEQVTE